MLHCPSHNCHIVTVTWQCHIMWLSSLKRTCRCLLWSDHCSWSHLISSCTQLHFWRITKVYRLLPCWRRAAMTHWVIGSSEHSVKTRFEYTKDLKFHTLLLSSKSSSCTVTYWGDDMSEFTELHNLCRSRQWCHVCGCNNAALALALHG